MLTDYAECRIMCSQVDWYPHGDLVTAAPVGVTFAVTQGGYVLEVIHTEVERDDNTCKSPLTHFTVLPPLHDKQIMKMQPILTWGHSWGKAGAES